MGPTPPQRMSWFKHFLAKVKSGIELLLKANETEVETIERKLSEIRNIPGGYEDKLDALSRVMVEFNDEVTMSSQTLLWIANNVSLSTIAIKRKHRVFLGRKDVDADNLGYDQVYKDGWEQGKVESAMLLNTVVNTLVPYYRIYALAIPNILAGQQPQIPSSIHANRRSL
jgi:hypothetical protein